MGACLEHCTIHGLCVRPCSAGSPCRQPTVTLCKGHTCTGVHTARLQGERVPQLPVPGPQ